MKYDELKATLHKIEMNNITSTDLLKNITEERKLYDEILHKRERDVLFISQWKQYTIS